MVFCRFSSVYIPHKPGMLTKIRVRVGVWADMRASIEIKVEIQKTVSVEIEVLLLSV